MIRGCHVSGSLEEVKTKPKLAVTFNGEEGNPAMIYGTFQQANKAWESVALFDTLPEALEILEFFAKGHPWLISSDPAELEATITACEREALAAEIEAFLGAAPLDPRVKS